MTMQLCHRIVVIPTVVLAKLYIENADPFQSVPFSSTARHYYNNNQHTCAAALGVLKYNDYNM
jgi:hypothetical protein